MKRHTTFMLTGMMILGLAAGGIAQLSFAQSSPLIGTWKLNIEKSTFSGTPPRSRTATFAQDGQNIRNTVRAIDAQGNSATVVLLHIYDGRPHPTMGVSDFDVSTYTRVDANTEIFARFKDGNLVMVGTTVVSPDGKTETITSTGTGSGPFSGNYILVYDSSSSGEIALRMG